jgi:hypothetical protein
MSVREAALSAGLVLLVAAIARLVVAAMIVFPTPEDTAYYVGVARNLVDGRGLTADAIWSFQTPPLTFPRPAFEVWLPLPSLLAAIPMAVAGASFRAAQVAPVVAGVIVPVLTWRLGADVADELGLPPGRARTLAIGSGLTAAVSLPLLLHSALPDSTMPFAAIAVAACLLMPRLLRAATDSPNIDRRPTFGLIGLGVLIGLAALTRNEAIWLGLAWLAVVWWTRPLTTRQKVVLVAIPAFVALAMFAPWAIRDWRTFGTPFPGQALSNALSIDGSDIFAWQDPPTLSRYLALGVPRLLELRLEGLGHNLFNVLLLTGMPASLVGLFGLPVLARLRSAQPTLVVAGLTFLATSLLFPVSTTWGTFLHAAGPAHVALIVGALVVLDLLIVRIGRLRGWTRPVAWLGAGLTVFGCGLFSVGILPAYAANAATVRDRYIALASQLQAANVDLRDGGPVISDFPIWLADTLGVDAIALPSESPDSVVDLARTFGSRWLVTSGGPDALWPAVLQGGGMSAGCFSAVDLPIPADPTLARAIAGTRVFRVSCP